LKRATEVAQLAAGLAHEIRNPMHAIRINLHALAKVDSDRRLKLAAEEHTKLLAESDREIERVEKLMHELVTFASPDKPKIEILDLKTEVQSLLDFINREMTRQHIVIATHFASTSAHVRFDADRLRQIMLNLMQNAEQALRGPGKIDISISSDAERVSLRVADNGPGIPEEDRQRIFEPFYSTKANGSGLGLALVRRFVTEADGAITCESNSPKGTIFRIELPRATGVKKGS
jgi:two-component system sensor histidine kinase AtoS